MPRAERGRASVRSPARHARGRRLHHRVQPRSGGLVALGVRFVRLDVQQLPFRDASFDVVAMLETIYYLADAAIRRRSVASLASGRDADRRKWQSRRTGLRPASGIRDPYVRSLRTSCAALLRWVPSRRLRGVPGLAAGQRPTNLDASANLCARAFPVARRHSRSEDRCTGRLRDIPRRLDDAQHELRLIEISSDRIDRVHQVPYAVGMKPS